MTYLNLCEENAGPELGFDYRVCGRGPIMPNLWKVIKCVGPIMPNLWKVIKCVVPRGLCMRSSKSMIQA